MADMRTVTDGGVMSRRTTPLRLASHRHRVELIQVGSLRNAYRVTDEADRFVGLYFSLAALEHHLGPITVHAA